MVDSKIISCVVFSTLYLGINSHNDINFADKLEKYVKNYVAIVTPEKVSATTSALSSSLIRQVMEKYPTIVLNSIKNLSDLDDENLPAIQQMFQTKHQKQILKIAIVDAIKSENITQELVDSIDFLKHFSFQSTRPKTLVFLYVKQKISLKNFFAYAWSEKFLYVTVMEFLLEEENFYTSSKNKFNLMLHQYNPFNNSYHSEKFSATTEIFSEKLSDLHEFPLKFGVLSENTYLLFQEDDSKVSSNSIAKSIELAKATTKTLNSKIEFKQIRPAYPAENRATNVSLTKCEEIGSCLIDDEIDYVVEWTDTTNFPLFIFAMDILGKLVLQSTRSFLIKQYSDDEFKVTLIITISLGVSLICITMFILRRKFNEKVWTLYNMIKILIGVTIRPEPQKMSERIFFLCLTFIYCICFADIVQESLKTSNYKELNTLKDITDVGIVPRVTPGIIDTLLSGNEDDIGMVKNLIFYDDTDGINKCLSYIIQDDKRNYNCCEVSTDIGVQVAKKFVHDYENRLISLMKEPFGLKFKTLYHSSISPYKDRFNQILQRLIETGLVKHWSDRANWLEEAKTYVDYKYAAGTQSVMKNMAYLVILTVCYFLSILTFFIEILYFRISQKYAKKVAPDNDEMILFDYTD